MVNTHTYDGPLRFAHRGLAQAAPENTFGAFEAAMDLRLEGIEIDIQLSRDGEIIVSHDSNFTRMTLGHPSAPSNRRLRDMTWEEIKNAGTELSAALTDAPSQVVSLITEANTASRYGQPIDEKSDSPVKQVHAAAGGMVLSSGRDEEIGLYIRIQHEDAVSVYGNLADIGVVESERVQRGEIIGSYDTDCGKDFYFALQEDEK